MILFSIQLSYGDTVYTDASKSLLEAWLDVIDVVEFAFSEEVHHHARVIFDKFIECHIDGSGTDQEVNEVKMKSEREANKEQLIIIGFLGRLNVQHSLTQLALYTEAKLNELCTCMENPDSVTKIFDALTWLIMISGHVLCMDAIGEKPLIPRDINQLSVQLSQEHKIDSQSTLTTLQSSVQLQLPQDKCDPTVRIFANILRLCEMENRAIESGFGATWSPLLSSTIMWFIGQYLNIYILIDATYYNPLAPVFAELFTIGSALPANAWCMNFILNKVAWNMHKYHHDVDVVEESIRLFLDIVNVRNQKLPHVIELESFQNLIHMRDLQLDSKIKRSVYKGLIMATAAFQNVDQRQECLRHLLEPIGARFDSVCAEASRLHHETHVREKVLVVLDEMTGVAQGINGSTFPFVYQTMRERFHRLPDIMLLFRNYLDINVAVMKVLIEMTTIQVATSGAVDLSRDFYEVCFRAMRCYMEQQGQRIEKIYGDDEEQPDDVLIFVELFKKLTIQYVFEQAEHSVVANLGITILSNLMPKMYPLLERFPDIAMAYYKSLNCFIELLVCNNELHQLPAEILNHILYTIKIGLTSFTYPEIQGHSLDLLITFGDSLIQDTENRLQHLRELTVEPFGKLLFDVIVGLNLHSENKNDCYGAIYLLACASRTEINFCHETVTALVNKQKERVTYATDSDTPEVEKLKNFVFSHSREQKMSFIDLLDKFVSSICFLYHQV
ncbi:hypothetical protein PVAND_016835 [Polypedilum vanderplanki]|uniref:Exportin-1 C-terminal domain-containing protein n=1 Tax=Polypedilum vanderplanki TaxID=319348 RepID=A0A9J6BGK2_POLVA|nr:hypothetical protein PVAND_016835 [Polypedilum vanderplanki]